MLGLLENNKSIYLVKHKVILERINRPSITAKEWKKVPQWLEIPAMLFDSASVKGRLVFIAPELINSFYSC